MVNPVSQSSFDAYAAYIAEWASRSAKIKSLMHSNKRRGPRREPCETPISILRFTLRQYLCNAYDITYNKIHTLFLKNRGRSYEIKICYPLTKNGKLNDVIYHI